MTSHMVDNLFCHYRTIADARMPQNNSVDISEIKMAISHLWN